VAYRDARGEATVAPGQPATLSVQPAIGALAAGVYTGDLSIHFAEPNTHPARRHPADRDSPAQRISENRIRRTRPSDANPTKLLPIFTQLGQSFSATARLAYFHGSYRSRRLRIGP